MLQKIKNFFTRLLSNKKVEQWEAFEYFEEPWKERIRFMAQFIPNGKSVVDLGCGKMWLQEYLNDNEYYPVDYKSRGEKTIVCDFNKHEFPSQHADVAFVSGCMEYVRDCDWFVQNIADNFPICIFSYCTIEEYPNLEQRRKGNWINDFSSLDVINLFEKNGMKLQSKSLVIKNTIFVFEGKSKMGNQNT